MSNTIWRNAMIKPAVQNSQEQNSSLSSFKKFIKSKRFKNFCEDNNRFGSFDSENVDDLLALKHHMDETLSWKKSSKDIKNATYLQHVIGNMVEDYVNARDMEPKGRQRSAQPSKNPYAPLPRLNTSSKEFYAKLNPTGVRRA